jgi:hypothetical protein
MTTLSHESFSAEIASLRKLHKDIEEQRRKEAELKAEEDERLARRIATAQAREIEAQLIAHEVESKERAKRQKVWTGILTSVATLLTAVVGSVAYMMASPKTQAEKAEAAAPLIQAIEEKTSEVEQRVSLTEAKVERLKDVVLDQQVQISDSTEYLGNLIKTTMPESADVPRPKSLDDAARKASAIKAARERERQPMFDPDPFSGIQ